MAIWKDAFKNRWKQFDIQTVLHMQVPQDCKVGGLLHFNIISHVVARLGTTSRAFSFEDCVLKKVVPVAPGGLQ